MVEKKIQENPLPDTVVTVNPETPTRPDETQTKTADTQSKPEDIQIPATMKGDTLPVDSQVIPMDTTLKTMDNTLKQTDNTLKQTDIPFKPVDTPAKPADTPAKLVDTPAKPVELPIKPEISSPRLTIAGFMKMEPNDAYRRLLPAVLFVLTFVTVMSMLLIYMDNVAANAQQFRLNMSRDYELSRISQESAPLVAYVRELHLAPAPHREPEPTPRPTPSVHVIDRLLGDPYNGTFVEFLPSGPRSRTTLYLESGRQWSGVAVRAAARDFFDLRASTRALHACLSNTQHPREVSYAEVEKREAVFRSRVLCLPLYTVLLAADATLAQYVLLGGDAAYAALTHVPYHDVHLKIIEVLSSDPSYRNKTTKFLSTKNYTVAASFTHSVMYVLN